VQKEKGFLKSVLNNILNEPSKTKIAVNFKSKEKWSKETKTMVDLLPSGCFVNKSLLSFVVAYREYSAEYLQIATG
jgi:accessory colonization factor AcfC